MIESKEIINPFPGLRPFETDEYRLFFGRERQSDALIARLNQHEKLLVVVDQFEELVRLRAARAAASTGDDAAAFVKLLLEAAQQRDLSIYVVPTMRSDFLGDCAQFQGLPEAINDGQYL